MKYPWMLKAAKNARFQAHMNSKMVHYKLKQVLKLNKNEMNESPTIQKILLVLKLFTPALISSMLSFLPPKIWGTSNILFRNVAKLLNIVVRVEIEKAHYPTFLFLSQSTHKNY